MTSSALPKAAPTAPAKVAPIKTAYPAAEAPELRTADYFSVDYCSFTYIASWLVIFVILMLASIGMGTVVGYLSGYLGG